MIAFASFDSYQLNINDAFKTHQENTDTLNVISQSILGRVVYDSSQCFKCAGVDCMFLIVFSQLMFLFSLIKVKDKHSSSDQPCQLSHLLNGTECLGGIKLRRQIFQPYTTTKGCTD